MPYTLEERGAGDGPFIRRVDADDGTTTYVIDFGPAGPPVHAEVVGETLIVARDDGDEQVEFDLPSSEARTFMRNGVLTVEVIE